MKPDLLMLSITVLLVVGACILYVTEWVGLAQFLLVMASGTAGAAVVLLTERWGPDD